MALMFSHLFLAFLLFFSIQPFSSQSRIMKSQPQPFNFLQNMDQLQKGQTVTGLQGVKKYLFKFGYYPTDSIMNDEFDDVFEFAIKTYQNYYKLNITGKLDSDTMMKLNTPRCGVRDITNMTYTTKAIKGTKDMFFSVSAASDVKRWSPEKKQLSYNFKSGIPLDEILSEQEIKTAFSQAFRSWEGASEFKFQEVSKDSSADIVIGFYKGDHGDGDPFDGPGRVSTHTFDPEDGRSHYDGDESWSTNPDNTQMDLQSVAVHELGHALGLAHSQDPKAIMYPTLLSGIIKRELTQVDVNSIKALYSN